MNYKLTVCESGPEYNDKISASQDLYNFLREKWEDIEMRESFAVVAIGSNNQILGYSFLFTGGIDSCVVDPRLLFSWLLLVPKCVSFFIAHNHPSGNATPSVADRNLNKKILEGGEILSLRLMDSLIFTKLGYYSAADNGCL